jgi:fumarate hydratase, class I
MSECVIPTLTSMEVVESKSVLPAGWKADLSDLRGLDLTPPVLELMRRTTSRLPQDVIEALVRGRDAEEEGSRAFNTLNDMVRNILLADGQVTPLCQDTGTVIPTVSASAPPRNRSAKRWCSPRRMSGCAPTAWSL